MKYNNEKYIEYEVDGDGSCLFNSIAIHILHKTNKKKTKENVRKKAKMLRQKAVTFLKKKIKEENDLYIQIMGGSINSNKSTLEKAKIYTKLMRKSTTWGTQIEILALQEYIHKLGFKRIEVYNSKTKNVIKNMKTANNPNATKGVIRLVLSGVNEGGCHYNPLLEKRASIKHINDNKLSID